MHKNIAPNQAGMGANELKLNVADSAANGRDKASTIDDAYNTWFCKITGGTGSGQIIQVSDYVAATPKIVVESNWAPKPDATSTYEITPNNPAEPAPLGPPEFAKKPGAKFFMTVYADAANVGDAYFYGPEVLVRNLQLPGGA